MVQKSDRERGGETQRERERERELRIMSLKQFMGRPLPAKRKDTGDDDKQKAGATLRASLSGTFLQLKEGCRKPVFGVWAGAAISQCIVSFPAVWTLPSRLFQGLSLPT